MEEKKNHISAFDQAVSRLSRRSQSTFEMKKYLKERGYSQEEVEEAVELLLEYHYLDDAAYAESYFRYGQGKNWSKRRILQELKQRGVDASAGEMGWQRYIELDGEPDEYEMAKKEAAKVLRMTELDSQGRIPEKIRARVARRLLSRGYSQSLIYQVLGDLERMNDI